MAHVTRGFTLLETLIYIALLAVIMGGTLAAVYNVLQGAGRVSAHNTTQEEGNFVLRKIDWALSSASNIVVAPSTLTVGRYDGNTVDFRINSGVVEMRESAGGFGYLPITTSNVAVGGLVFTNHPAVGAGPQGVTATLVIDGLTFETTKYLPK